MHAPIHGLAGAALVLLLSIQSATTEARQTPPPVASALQPAAAAPCDPGWSGNIGNVSKSHLFGVSSSTAGSWAVGMTSNGDEPRYPLALHDDETGWSVGSVPTSTHATALLGASGPRAGGPWAVGYETRSSRFYPLAMRLRPSGWTRHGLGAIDDKGGSLVGVTARTDDAWTVGYRSSGIGPRPLAARFRDGSWLEKSPTATSAETGVLLAVDSKVTGDVWAVGWSRTNGPPRPLAWHRVGTTWRRTTVPLDAPEGVLTGVAVVRTDLVWATGYRRDGGSYRPVAFKWDGARWHDAGFADIKSPMGFVHGLTLDGSRLIVVGTRWDTSDNEWRGFVARRTLGTWYVTPAPLTTGDSQFRAGTLRPDGSIAVVGGARSRSLVMSLCQGESFPAPLASEGKTRRRAIERIDAPSSTPRTDRPRRRARGTATTAGGNPTVVARDVAAEVGLARTTATYGAVAADLDDDGWTDLFISRHGNPGWIAWNRAGAFETNDVAIERRDRHDCAAGDANGDGRIDLYCANGALGGSGIKRNELWIGQADHSFVEQAIPFRAADPLGRGRSVTFFDLDHDEHDDLFVGDRAARNDGLPSLHLVLAAPSGERYTGRSITGFDAASGSDCVVPADLDRDGWEDIVLCARGLDRPTVYGVHILRNDHGRLVDVTPTTGIAKRQAVDAAVADLDGDGRPDIVEVTPSQLRIWLRRANQRYVLGYTRALSAGRAVAVGDVDGDGDQDVYVVQGSTTRQRPDQMLRNNGTGESFKALTIPQATSGSADSVTAIDHDRNGLMDFLVLNGRGGSNTGPVQLIAFYPD